MSHDSLPATPVSCLLIQNFTPDVIPDHIHCCFVLPLLLLLLLLLLRCTTSMSVTRFSPCSVHRLLRSGSQVGEERIRLEGRGRGNPYGEDPQGDAESVSSHNSLLCSHPTCLLPSLPSIPTPSLSLSLLSMPPCLPSSTVKERSWPPHPTMCEGIRPAPSSPFPLPLSLPPLPPPPSIPLTITDAGNWL